jgi:RNA polymerase sigma-70 factor (ECF subfamily)
MTSMQTTVLIASAKAGCLQSQGELLERFRKYLKTLARLQLQQSVKAKADASDVVQEAFLKAHEAFTGFRGTTEAELCVWLRTILASRVANLLRFHTSRKRHVDLEQQVNEELSQSSAALGRVVMHPGPSPSEVVVQRERTVQVAAAIEDLPADYRTVVLLRDIRGLPYADIAQRMERSVHSVKKLRVRALAQLQRAVEARS